MIEKPRFSHASKVAQKLVIDAKLNKIPIDLESALSFLGINLLPYPFPEDKVSAILMKEDNLRLKTTNRGLIHLKNN